MTRPPTPSQEEGLPVASVAVIIHPRDRGGSVLLIKRTERSNDPWSGQIGFPGGHKSPNESFLQTAIREAEEEVGIHLNEAQLLGCLPMVITLSRRVEVAPFVFKLESGVEIRANREVAESFWVPLLTLARLEVKKHSVQLDDSDVEVNCFDYQGRIIWGLTFRILNLMLGRRLDDEL